MSTHPAIALLIELVARTPGVDTRVRDAIESAAPHIGDRLSGHYRQATRELRSTLRLRIGGEFAWGCADVIRSVEDGDERAARYHLAKLSTPGTFPAWFLHETEEPVGNYTHVLEYITATSPRP